MNLPNKITLFRVIMIPFFVFIYLSTFIAEPHRSYIAVTIFVIASFSDFLDGYIARKYNLVTNLGKFADTLADKLLVSAALICMVEKGLLPSWLVILILSREFIITSFRTIAAVENIIIAASPMGKIKTNVQMAMIIFIMSGFTGVWARYTSVSLICLAAIFTIVSAVEYILNNIEVFKK